LIPNRLLISVYFLILFAFFSSFLYSQCDYPPHVSNWAEPTDNYNYNPQWQGIIESSGTRVGTHVEPFEGWEVSAWHWMSYYSGTYYCCEGWSAHWYTNPFAINNYDDEGNYYFIHYGSVNSWNENTPYVTTWITSDKLDLTLCSNDKISFSYKIESDGPENNTLEIQYSLNQSEWITIESFNEQTIGWVPADIDIEDIIPQVDNVWIRIKSTVPTSINSNYYWSHTYLDDIVIPPVYGTNSSSPPMSFDLLSPEQNETIILEDGIINDQLSFSFLPIDNTADQYHLHLKGIQSIELITSNSEVQQISISEISNYMIQNNIDTMEILWDISVVINDWELYSDNGPHIFKIVNGQCPINYSWSNGAVYDYPDPNGVVGNYDSWSVYGDTHTPYGNWNDWVIQPWIQTGLSGSDHLFLSSIVESWDGNEANVSGSTYLTSQRLDLSLCTDDELSFDYAIISNSQPFLTQTLFAEFSYDNTNWTVLDSINTITSNGYEISVNELTNHSISLETINFEQSDEFYIKFRSYHSADINIPNGIFYHSNIILGNVYTPPLFGNTYEDDSIEPLTLLSPPNQEVVDITENTGVFSFFWDNPNDIDTLNYDLVFGGDLEFLQSQTINSSLAVIQTNDIFEQMVDLETDSISGSWQIDIINVESSFNESQNGPFQLTFFHNNILKNINSSFPNEFSISQNFPNPFNPITSLRYDLPEDGLVNITIYDMMGRIVKTLVNSSQTAGYKSIRWNATNDRNEPASAGLYLYTIQAGQFRQTRKMVLLK